MDIIISGLKKVLTWILNLFEIDDVEEKVEVAMSFLGNMFGDISEIIVE